MNQNSRLLSDWIDLSEPGTLEYRDANDEKRGDKQYLSKTKGVKLGGSLRVNCIPTSPSQCNISISVFPRSLSELTRVSPLYFRTGGHCTYVLFQLCSLQKISVRSPEIPTVMLSPANKQALVAR